MKHFHECLKQEIDKALAAGLPPREATSLAHARMTELLKAQLRVSPPTTDIVVAREDVVTLRQFADESVALFNVSEGNITTKNRAMVLLELHYHLAGAYSRIQYLAWEEAQEASAKSAAELKAKLEERPSTVRDLSERVQTRSDDLQRQVKEMQEMAERQRQEGKAITEEVKAAGKAIFAEMTKLTESVHREGFGLVGQWWKLQELALQSSEKAGELARIAREARAMSEVSWRRWVTQCHERGGTGQQLV